VDSTPDREISRLFLYTDHSTDSTAYVGMAEHNYWELLVVNGGIWHECRGSNSEY